MCFSARHSFRCLSTLPFQPTSNSTKNEVIVRSTELNLTCFNLPYNHGYMATVKQAATQASAPATMPWMVTFKGAKTTKHGLVSQHDVMSAGRMQVDDVITTCHSISYLTAWPTEAPTITASYCSPRDHPQLQPIPAHWLSRNTPRYHLQSMRRLRQAKQFTNQCL